MVKPVEQIPSNLYDKGIYSFIVEELKFKRNEEGAEREWESGNFTLRFNGGSYHDMVVFQTCFYPGQEYEGMPVTDQLLEDSNYSWLAKNLTKMLGILVKTGVLDANKDYPLDTLRSDAFKTDVAQKVLGKKFKASLFHEPKNKSARERHKAGSINPTTDPDEYVNSIMRVKTDDGNVTASKTFKDGAEVTGNTKAGWN